MDVNRLTPEKNLLRRYPLVAFFVLAYVFFFLTLLIIGGVTSLVPISDTLMGVLVALASWTPNLAALVVVGINQGSEGVRNVLAGWLKWQVNVGWYAFGLAPLAIALAAAGLYALPTGTAPSVGMGITSSTLLSMFVFHSIQGATGEELGWRGFALPGLQRRFSALLSAVILGLIISGWHSILHLVSPVGVPEWQFWLIMVCYSVLVTWAYNNTGGSLLIISLFHFAFNFSLELVTTQLGLIPLRALFWIFSGVYLLLAVGVVALAGPRRLSRRSESVAVAE